jgi:NAD+--asparagine ADP-ribosyltransferase
MTTQEIFAELKVTLPTAEFKVVKSNVYRKLHFEKRFSFYQTVENFISHHKELVYRKNASKNYKIAKEYLISLGLEIKATSTNSIYFISDKGIIRVSDHHWTSEKHNEPILNLCSYDQNGHIQMINEINNLLN